MGLLPEPLTSLAPSCLVGLEGGQEQLAVFGGEVGGGFPDEVGDVAVGRQALQGCAIHVGADREPVVEG